MGFDLLGVFVFGWEFYSSFISQMNFKGKSFIFFWKILWNLSLGATDNVIFPVSNSTWDGQQRSCFSEVLRMGKHHNLVSEKTLFFLFYFFLCQVPSYGSTKPWLTHFMEACEQTYHCICIIITYRQCAFNYLGKKESYYKLMTVLFQANTGYCTLQKYLKIPIRSVT